mgnify:CR=1 FL=1
MSVRIDTYSLLVDKFGEAVAYKICEELGGSELKIPRKAHKTYRAKQIIKNAMPLLNVIEEIDPKKKTSFVKKIAQQQGLVPNSIYKIIREERYGK